MTRHERLFLLPIIVDRSHVSSGGCHHILSFLSDVDLITLVNFFHSVLAACVVHYPGVKPRKRHGWTNLLYSLDFSVATELLRIINTTCSNWFAFLKPACCIEYKVSVHVKKLVVRISPSYHRWLGFLFAQSA